jgi:hypothetical protein
LKTLPTREFALARRINAPAAHRKHTRKIKANGELWRVIAMDFAMNCSMQLEQAAFYAAIYENEVQHPSLS